MRDSDILEGASEIAQCIRRASDKELANLSTSGIDQIRRTAKRTMKRLTYVNAFDKLSEDDKRAHNVGMSHLGAIYACSKPEMSKKIEARVTAASGKLDLTATLALVRGKDE